MEELLTTHDAARILGLHPFTVGRQIDKGFIKAFRTAGGHRRVAASDLRRYFVERSIPIPAELALKEHRLKLLVVDDEQHALSAIKRAFKPFAGEVVLTATLSGVEALLLMSDIRPDGLLFDINMPGVDGFELCRRVTAFKPLAAMKLVAMTSLYRSDIIGSSLTAGAVACLEKPINANEVLALIARPAPATRSKSRASANLTRWSPKRRASQSGASLP